MKRLRLIILELRIEYNRKKWLKAIEGMNKHLYNYNGASYKRYSERNSKYGQRSLELMNKKMILIKELGLDK